MVSKYFSCIEHGTSASAAQGAAANNYFNECGRLTDSLVFEEVNDGRNILRNCSERIAVQPKVVTTIGLEL